MTKKQVFKIIIFIGIVLWLMVHITYCIRMNGDVKDRFVGFYSEKRDTVDVVMFGSSPVYPCISTPKIYGDMGITVYPLSSNMQRPVATKYLAKEALKTQDPDLFIFEMKMWAAEDENLLGNMAHTREVTDNMKYSLNRIDAINAMVDNRRDDTGEIDPNHNRLYYYFDIFKYHSNWKTLILPSQLRTFFYSYPDEFKGYVPETEVGLLTKENHHEVAEVAKMPAEQEEYLEDLIKFLEDNNKQALFVVLPYAVTVEEQMKINYIKEYVTDRGYNFLDMNQHLSEMSFDESTDYKDDGTHTNIVGAEKATAFLEKYLDENYVKTGILGKTDRRQDKRCRSWDEAYKRWLTAYEEGKETVAYNFENGIFAEPPEEEE